MNSASVLNKVILGTVQLGIPYGINNSAGKPKQEEALEILSVAMDHGIMVLDTADAYGNAPEIIGEFHKKSDRKFEVITKFSTSHGPKGLLQKVDKSLQTLGVDYLYAYLFHNPNDFFSDPQMIEDLKKAKSLGLIKNAGISIYTNKDFEAAIDTEEITLIQIPYNLLDNKNLRGDLIERAKAKSKIIHTRSAFLQGLFFRPLTLLPEKINSLATYLSAIKEISDNNEVDVQELALSYVLNNTSIDGVILGVDTLDQLLENIEMLKKIGTGSTNYNQLVDKIHVKEVELLNPGNWK